MLIEKLSRQSGLSQVQLLHLARTASRRYRTYHIPKRNGQLRTIHHPGRKIKAIQRWLLKVILAEFPVHESSKAYKSGSSIRANVEAHQHTNYSVRFDFENFFPSFKGAHIAEFIGASNETLALGLSEADIDFIVSIATRFDELTIGAPTSPALTNAMMFNFDNAMHDHAVAEGLIYTRYADDVFISSRDAGRLQNLEVVVENFSRTQTIPDLNLNRDKTVYLSKKYKRSITGLVITSDNRISIGREKKRILKSLVHKLIFNELDDDRRKYLEGMIAYTLDVEPSFVDSLSAKYGERAISKLLKKTEK